jgi:integrase
VDCVLDVPPKPEDAPHGWCRLPPLKGQRPALVYLTELQRQVLDEATGERWNGARMEPGYLSDLEQRWQEKGIDYPLIPGGPWPRSGVFTASREISKGALDRWLIEAEKKAGVPRIARRAWHGIRRSWTDYLLDAAGMETVVAAGAWSDEDMPRHVYAERIRHQHLKRSREAQEQKRGPR